MSDSSELPAESMLWRKKECPAAKTSNSLTRNRCSAAAALCSRALLFTINEALLGQTKLDRPANGSPFGRAVTEGD